MVAKLNAAERKAALEKLSGWKKMPKRDAIVKTYQFKDFNAAFGWMTRIALIAEQMDHHPEWFNVYNRVEVVLTTHDADGISQRDVDMAKQMDRLAGAAGRKA